MKIKTTLELVDFEGKTMKVNNSPVLLRTILINGATYENSGNKEMPIRKLSSEEKIKAYCLGRRIMEKDEVDLTTDEIVFIKKGLQAASALVYGQVVDILEGNA